MKKCLKYYISTYILFLSLASACKVTLTHYENKETITHSCDLKNNLNDTIVVNGKFWRCMEYDDFSPIKKDECINDMDIELNFRGIELDSILGQRLSSMHGCNYYINMIVKGVLRNDNPNGYGHLGSNNTELEVLKVIQFGKVKYQRIKISN